MLKGFDKKIGEINKQIIELKSSPYPEDAIYMNELERSRDQMIEIAWSNLTAEDRVYLARHPERPKADWYVSALFEDFFEVHGDRYFGDDNCILTGIAMFDNTPVTVIAQRKGTDLEENIKYNFGMPEPEGYRKAIRAVEQAQKFNRPVITLIDTPGAYPGLGAEERGQGEAIAQSIQAFSALEVPVISIIIGEGGSGGALAIGVCNTLIMLENSIYSILSPEGFATILWKDGSRVSEATKIMKLTAKDLYELKVADFVVEEGIGGINLNRESVLIKLNDIIRSELQRLKGMRPKDVQNHRYKKYRELY